MPSYEVHLNCPNTNNRKKIRDHVVDVFKSEQPGTGTGELSTKYTYYVETLTNGNRIFLTRPAFLNKGFDFVVRVENTPFGNNQNNPRHIDIINDLLIKKDYDINIYDDLYNLIVDVYNCNDILPFQNRHLQGLPGYDVDLILGVIKWLYIEQDVTYWNFSGRAKLMSYIPTPY